MKGILAASLAALSVVSFSTLYAHNLKQGQPLTNYVTHAELSKEIQACLNSKATAERVDDQKTSDLKLSNRPLPLRWNSVR